MDEKIEQWNDRLETVTREVVKILEGASEEILNIQPGPGKWSIGQHLEHLIIINESYFPVLEKVSDPSYKTPWQGRVGFLVRFFGKTILKSIQPDNKRKTKTMPVWVPSDNKIEKNIIDLFKDHQARMKDFFRSSKDLLERRVVIPSPANSTIQYYLPQAFEIIVAHEERHLGHIKEALMWLDD